MPFYPDNEHWEHQYGDVWRLSVSGEMADWDPHQETALFDALYLACHLLARQGCPGVETATCVTQGACPGARWPSPTPHAHLCWLSYLLNKIKGIILAGPPPKRLPVFQPILKPPCAN